MVKSKHTKKNEGTYSEEKKKKFIMYNPIGKKCNNEYFTKIYLCKPYK